MNDKNRYNRQVILPEIGQKGQKKLTSASVLCIGAGGLGCPALLYLAGAGVGHLGIVDFDVVDETNLQRQILFSTEQIGQNKAEAAKSRLLALNPEIEILAYPEELTAKNAQNLLANYDIIIDGSDNFATKYLINDAAIKTGKPFIFGSISGFNGQISVFNFENGPCYRCLFPAPPKGHVPNCAEAGVIGAVAGMIGTAQAMEAIKIIVAHKDFTPLAGKFWNIDMLNMENQLLSLTKNPNCPTCSKNKEEISLHYSSPVCAIIPELTKQQMLDKKQAVLVDVREIDEWEAGHIEGAKHIALSDLLDGFEPDLAKNCEIILYCQTGIRVRQAAKTLQTLGFSNINNLIGGYKDWQ